MSKHEGVRYPCKRCEYTATQGGHLKHYRKLFERKHEGGSYPCVNVKLVNANN